jgi:hypothetical protein
MRTRRHASPRPSAPRIRVKFPLLLCAHLVPEEVLRDDVMDKVGGVVANSPVKDAEECHLVAARDLGNYGTPILRAGKKRGANTDGET